MLAPPEPTIPKDICALALPAPTIHKEMLMLGEPGAARCGESFKKGCKNRWCQQKHRTHNTNHNACHANVKNTYMFCIMSSMIY